MGTAYYATSHRNGPRPDSNIPPGAILTQFTSFVGVTGNHGSGDTFYLFKLPKDAILVDFNIAGPAISSGTLEVGTDVAVESPDSSADGVATIAAADHNIIAGASVAGIFNIGLKGGYQGTTAIVQTTLNGTVRQGSKMLEETGIYATFSSGYPAANDVIHASVQYFMDYGSDMLYDPG